MIFHSSSAIHSVTETFLSFALFFFTLSCVGAGSRRARLGPCLGVELVQDGGSQLAVCVSSELADSGVIEECSASSLPLLLVLLAVMMTSFSSLSLSFCPYLFLFAFLFFLLFHSLLLKA